MVMLAAVHLCHVSIRGAGLLAIAHTQHLKRMHIRSLKQRYFSSMSDSPVCSPYSSSSAVSSSCSMHYLSSHSPALPAACQWASSNTKTCLQFGGALLHTTHMPPAHYCWATDELHVQTQLQPKAYQVENDCPLQADKRTGDASLGAYCQGSMYQGCRQLYGAHALRVTAQRCFFRGY